MHSFLPIVLLVIVTSLALTPSVEGIYKLDLDLDSLEYIETVNPARAYYDAKQAESREIRANLQPVYYEAFVVNIPDKVECDTLVPIHGIVPETGLLTWTIVSGDYISYSNLSHSNQWSLLNYLYIPCDEITTKEATIYSTFIFNETVHNEKEPNTKVKGLAIDRHFMHVEQEFQITGRLMFSLIR